MKHVSGNSWRHSPNRADNSHVTRWIFIGCGCFCPERLIPPQLSHIYQRDVTPPESLTAGSSAAVAHNVAVSVDPVESTGRTETPMVFALESSESVVGNELGNVAHSESEPASVFFEELPMTPAGKFAPFALDLSQGMQDDLSPKRQCNAMQAVSSCPLVSSPNSADMQVDLSGFFKTFLYFLIIFKYYL